MPLGNHAQAYGMLGCFIQFFSTFFLADFLAQLPKKKLL
jgi:hypothetical protein